MKLLLDTHIFLWYISRDSRLTDSVLAIIRDTDNLVYLSVVSLWETIIKHQPGRLTLPEAPEKFIPEQRERHRISSLDIDEASVSRLATLPPIHRDPFDRMLVCQALEHGPAIVTVDKTVRNYPVAFL